MRVRLTNHHFLFKVFRRPRTARTDTITQKGKLLQVLRATSTRTRKYLPLRIDNVEDIEEYRPGGYHPVHIGDAFQQRYRVLHKLGAGGFSTTWLAHDQMQRRYVALKILTADETAIDSEIRVLQHLANLRSDHPGRKHIRILQDHFLIEGPNGSHRCLVTDVAGPSLSELYNVPNMGYTAGSRRLRASSAKKVIRQLVEAVDFLHANRICHGDLTLPNVLLKLRGIDHWTEADLYEKLGSPSKQPLLTVEKTPADKCAPEYVVEPAKIPNAECVSDDICLVDFGEAFSFDSPPGPEQVGVPALYRSPETIFDSRYNQRSEIWSLACVLFEMRAGSPLFISIMGTFDEIVLQMVQMKGTMPEPWWSRWERRATCFDESGKPLKEWPDGRVLAVEYPLETTIADIGDDDDESAISEGPCADLLEPAFTRVPDPEATSMRDLLHKMLQWLPENRVTVEDVRCHPWIADSDSSST